MANIVTRTNGTKAVQFLDCRGTRRTVSLGRIQQTDADDIAFQVERLVSASNSGSRIPTVTKAWLADLPPKMHNRFAACGIIPGIAPDVDDEPEQEVTLTPFVDEWIAGRTDVKDSTRAVYGRCRNWLVSVFGESRTLQSITPGDADDWRRSLLRSGLDQNTARKMAGVAKLMFGYAMRKRLLTDNPFEDLPSCVQVNEDRTHTISVDVIERVIDAAPDSEWRLILALARFGGLRTPSEVFALKWGDIDFVAGRIQVPEPKVEHHAGRGRRTAPLFPELRPYLEESFEAASDGRGRVSPTRHVLTRHRLASGNLGTQLKRIIQKAGAEPWPKLFMNLRQSRQTELENQFPTHVVCKWLGNSPQVAHRHYLKVTTDHFEQALNSVPLSNRAANALQNRGEPGCMGMHGGFVTVSASPVHATGCNDLPPYAERHQWSQQDSNL